MKRILFLALIIICSNAEMCARLLFPAHYLRACDNFEKFQRFDGSVRIDNIFKCNILSDSTVEVGLNYDEFRKYIECLPKNKSYICTNIRIPETVEIKDTSDNFKQYTVVKIADCGFRRSGNIDTLFIPATVRSVGDAALSGLGSIRKIIFPEEIDTIGDYAMFDFSRSVTLPRKVKYIGHYAMYYTVYRSGMSSMYPENFYTTLPDSLTFVGDHAFGPSWLMPYDFPYLDLTDEEVLNRITYIPCGVKIKWPDTLYISPKVRDIHPCALYWNYDGDAPFFDYKRSYISVDPANPYFASIYGILFCKDDVWVPFPLEEEMRCLCGNICREEVVGAEQKKSNIFSRLKKRRKRIGRKRIEYIY